MDYLVDLDLMIGCLLILYHYYAGLLQLDILEIPCVPSVLLVAPPLLQSQVLPGHQILVLHLLQVVMTKPLDHLPPPSLLSLSPCHHLH